MTKQQQRVDNAIRNAQALMTPESERKINEIAKRRGGMIGTMGSADLSYFEQQAFGYSQQQPQAPMQQQYQTGNPSVSSEQIANSSLPDVIKESFMQMPPIAVDNSSSTYVPGASLLQEQYRTAPQQPTYNIQPYPPMQQQYPTNTGGIDYNVLKYIINECIRENLNIIKESLNENQIIDISLPGKNKIQLRDNAGNIFEGSLIKKKTKKA